MLKDLREVFNNKGYTEISMMDGSVVCGFVTHISGEIFHIMTLEPTINSLKDLGEDEFGDKIYSEGEETDYILVKHSYMTDMISGIVHDITHRVKPEMLKTLFFYRDNMIYNNLKKPVTKRKKNVTKKQVAKPLTDT